MTTKTISEPLFEALKRWLSSVIYLVFLSRPCYCRINLVCKVFSCYFRHFSNYFSINFPLLLQAIDIASTRAFKRYNATLLPVAFPGCKRVSFGSDPYWSCVARHVSTTLGHFAGTCKMGTRKNSGVVDHRLRVHGINGLRVVDASIIPTLIAGHTNAPAYMIAEKAADMIKEDWRLLSPERGSLFP